MSQSLVRTKLVPRTTTSDVDAARSAQMARVRGKDTRPELRVRKALHAGGLRFRLQARDLPGRPDIIFRSRRIAIFVHGCFWHQHPDPNCRLARMPKSRREFWEPKLTGNRERDARNKAALEAEGWTVIEVWECASSGRELKCLVEMVRARPPSGKWKPILHWIVLSKPARVADERGVSPFPSQLQPRSKSPTGSNDRFL
jgi:DNA mismatch endonuclease (patch repair protein)